MKRFLILALLAASFAAASARGDQIIYSQPPAQSGGFAADTDYTSMSGREHSWQQVADNFTLSSNVAAASVQFWGFYLLDGIAPANESMRVRFYASRTGDGLPDDNAILFEQTLQNPARQATGATIPVSVNPPEFKYSVVFSSPMHLLADTTYWMEILQIGNPDSDFYWETADLQTHDGIAGKNINFPNWHLSGVGGADMAFELSTPEPATGCLLACSLVLPILNRSRYSVAAQG